MATEAPRQGEVWECDLDPTAGREQAGRRPCLILSSDQFNAGPFGLVVIVPLTRTDRGMRLHVEINPPHGGVREPSFAMSEQVRAISGDRLVERWGACDREIVRVVIRRLGAVLRVPS